MEQQTSRLAALCLAVACAAATFAGLAARPAENYRVDPLRPGLWRIQAVTGTQSTAYVIEGTKEALVIDSCSGQEGLDAVVRGLIGTKAVAVALTHGHLDHSGGVKYFPRVFVHPADGGLLPAGLSVPRSDLGEGSVFDLGGKTIGVITIPGHTPGSVAFIDRANRYIMTGDGIGSTMVWMQISSLPLTTYLLSVKKLEAIKGAIDELYVGHHEQERVKLTPQYITDMRIVTERVLEGSIETKPYEMGNFSGRQATYGSATLVYHPDRLRPPSSPPGAAATTGRPFFFRPRGGAPRFDRPASTAARSASNRLCSQHAMTPFST